MVTEMLFLALALNLDCFAVVLSFALSGIRLPFLSKVMIIAACGLSITIAMLGGETLAVLVPPNFWHYLAGAVLIIVGVALLCQNEGKCAKVIKSPQSCDKNNDRKISPKEAVMLGFALAVDGFAVGIALGIASFPLVKTVGMMLVIQTVLLLLAGKIGQTILLRKNQSSAVRFFEDYGGLCSAVLIITIGLVELAAFII